LRRELSGKIVEVHAGPPSIHAETKKRLARGMERRRYAAERRPPLPAGRDGTPSEIPESRAYDKIIK
jgi:hypothetical protein